MIFVTVGSQKFQFNRLIKKVDQMVRERVIPGEVFMQTGACDYMPQYCWHQPFLDRKHYMEMVDKCGVIITHGVTGTIVDAVKRKKKAIVVPRIVKYGEHVDDHQLQMLLRFQEMNLIYACKDVDDLPEALKTIRTHQFNTYESTTDAFLASVDDFIRSV